ncbi:hypothetical protein UlMin_004164 [Ulmus minor]
MNNCLLKPFNEDDVKPAVFGMSPTKTPGFDGMSALFFQKYWQFVGQDVTRTCLGLLNSNCNSAFVGGMLIHDNIIAGYEGIHLMKKGRLGNGKNMTLKLDMSKAFDRVEWKFIEVVMIKLGFAEPWILKIMNCISSLFFSFLLNGDVKGNISPGRGLRQGDPLSPFLFLLCSEEDAKVLCDVLKFYGDALGQLVNFDKFEVCFSKYVPNCIRDEVADFLQVNQVDCHEKYLGLPTFVDRCKKDIFLFIKNMQLVKDLHILIADFWWGSKRGKSKMHWSKWNVMCNGKERGGMGFRDLGCFNQALLAKQGWRLIRNLDSLVGKVLKACYFPNGNFLNARTVKHASLVWRSLVWGREIIEKGSRWRVGSGRNIDIFKDRWLPEPSNFKVTTPRILLWIFKVAMLRLDNGDWNKALIEYLFNDDDTNAILSLPIGSFDHDDVLFWHFTKDGDYTVKSGYKVALESRGLIEPSKSGPMQQ